MGNRVALVRVPLQPEKFNVESKAHRYNSPYLSAMYSYLKQSPIKALGEIKIFDFLLCPNMGLESLLDFDPDLVVLAKHYPGPQVQLRRFCMNLKLAFPEKITIALYGTTAPSIASPIEDGYADVVIFGEEPSLAQLITAVGDSEQLKDVKGIAYAEGGQLKINHPAVLSTNLDELPFPYLYHLHDDPYRGDSFEYIAQVFTSRSCVASCSFCHIHDSKSLIRGFNWRGMSPSRTVDMFENIRNQGVRFIGTLDFDFFGKSKNRIIDVANEILRRKLDVTIQYYIRPNEVLELKEDLPLLSKAGLWYVLTGIESFDDKKLRSLGKGLRADTNIAALELLKKNDFAVDFSLILFTPDTKLEDIEIELSTARRIIEEKPLLFKSPNAIFSNYLQYYESSYLRTYFLERLKPATTFDDYQQIFLSFIRNSCDPSYGLIPWFEDRRIPIVGIISYVLNKQISDKLNDVKLWVATTRTKFKESGRLDQTELAQLEKVMEWEYGIGRFTLDLIMDAVNRLKKIDPKNPQSCKLSFQELFESTYDRLENFCRMYLPESLASLDTYSSFSKYFSLWFVSNPAVQQHTSSM